MSSASASSENDVDVGSFNSTSSNSNSYADDTIQFTSAPKTETSNDGDLCTWYSGAICSRPRSCFDCLNAVIPGQECAISLDGLCMNSYMASSIGGYPMANFSYCSSEDTVCSACRANWTNDYEAGVVSSTAMCVGESGCICLSSCEVPDRNDCIVDNWCNPVLDSSHFRLVAGLIAGTIALFVIATVLTKRQLSQRQRQDFENREARTAARAALRESQRPTASAHLPQLNLSGWEGMREKLVSSEQGLLESGTRSTQLSLARSSTTPAAVVEQGEGYRSMSPNELPSRREL